MLRCHGCDREIPSRIDAWIWCEVCEQEAPPGESVGLGGEACRVKLKEGSTPGKPDPVAKWDQSHEQPELPTFADEHWCS